MLKVDIQWNNSLRVTRNIGLQETQPCLSRLIPLWNINLLSRMPLQLITKDNSISQASGSALLVNIIIKAISNTHVC